MKPTLYNNNDFVFVYLNNLGKHIAFFRSPCLKVEVYSKKTDLI